MTVPIILLIVFYLLPLLAYINLKNTIEKYKNKNNKNNLSGFEIARSVLDFNKLDKMYIVEKRGILTDNYDKNHNAVKLSSITFHDTTIYALLMASFISTEAILSKSDKQISLKVILNPLFDFITYIVYITIILGLCMNSIAMLNLSVSLLIITIFYHLVIYLVNNKIVNKSKDTLYRLNYYQEENKEEIDKINNAIRFYNLSHIVLCLFNLFTNIKEMINDMKK